MTVTRMLGIMLVVILLLIGACSKGNSVNPSINDLPGETERIFEGYLSDDHGLPLSNMVVSVLDPDGNVLFETVTDDEGYFCFDLDPHQDYIIQTRSMTSNIPNSRWEYSGYDDGPQLVNPQDGGVVDPSGGIRIWIAGGGNIQQVPLPDEYDVELVEQTPASYSIRTTNSMVKILESTDLSQLDTFIRLEGARGEHEAFQVVPLLNMDVNNLQDVEITASDLVNGNERITRDNISLFLEHYIEVYEPSDAGGATGFWPDALVPLTRPFDVTVDFPAPVWVDISIPGDAVPGAYNGQISFSTSNAGNTIIHYTLEVWDITFPRRFNMKATFGLDQEDIAGAHDLEPGLFTPDGREMARTYAAFLAERHISSHGGPLFQPTAWLNPDNRSYDIDFSPMEDDIDALIEEYDLPIYTFPLDAFDIFPNGFVGQGEDKFTDDFNARFTDFVEQVSVYLSTHGYLERFFITFVDEPASQEDYEMVRKFGDLIRQALIFPDHMVTEQPAPQEPEWGTLNDHVDIFCSSLRTFYLMGSEEAAREGGDNKEEWIYTSANVYPAPSYAIDKQGIETRLFEWFVYQHEFEGILYFSANSWSGVNPWEDPLTWLSGGGNGTGVLIYPGTQCYQYTGQDNVDGPVSSIRLELIRDGIEDAQLLYMLGNGNPVCETDQIMKSWIDYTHDPEELLQVRRDIASAIMN